MATEYISRDEAMSMPWANGQYDHEHANEHFICGLETYKEWLEQIPTADVVEVVRCKDCIHYDERWRRCFFWGKVSDIHVIEIGYCWRAERRADNGK